MNLDKQSVIAIILGVAVLIGWYAFYPGAIPQAPQTPQATEAASAEQKPESAVPTPAENVGSVSAAQIAALEKMPEVTIGFADGNQYVFQPVYATLEEVICHEQKTADRSDALHIRNEYPALAGAAPDFGAFGLRTQQGPLQVLKVIASKRVSDTQYSVERLVRTGSGATFCLKEVFTAESGNLLKAQIALSNPAKEAVAIPALLISGGDLAPWYRISGDEKSRTQELHSFDYCTPTGKVKSIDSGDKASKWAEIKGEPMRWVGVSNRFFALLFKADGLPLNAYAECVADSANGNKVILAAGTLPALVLEANGEKSIAFTYYLGSKQPDLLKQFDPQAKKVMRLGWFPIDFLAYIMLAILNWIYGFIGSFGWSIILLTLLVRTIFFPVTMKANASMQKMSQLSPKIKAIREQYKDQPMVAQTKMQELYRENHVNPLGGCLPMLIQIPVFLALYYALGSAAELRQQGFWWIQDLAQPDTVCHLFGIAVNPLIIAWTLLMVVQQKLVPTAMDPMQAKMMMFMPLMMLFFLYNLPSALTLYWTVSQIYSIVQMMYQRKLRKRGEQSQGGEPSSGSAKPRIVRS